MATRSAAAAYPDGKCILSPAPAAALLTLYPFFHFWVKFTPHTSIKASAGRSRVYYLDWKRRLLPVVGSGARKRDTRKWTPESCLTCWFSHSADSESRTSPETKEKKNMTTPWFHGLDSWWGEDDRRVKGDEAEQMNAPHFTTVLRRINTAARALASVPDRVINTPLENT